MSIQPAADLENQRKVFVVSVQLRSRVQLFTIPKTAGQVSLSATLSQSLLKFTSIELGDAT